MLEYNIVEALNLTYLPRLHGMELAPYSSAFSNRSRLSRLHRAISLSLSW